MIHYPPDLRENFTTNIEQVQGVVYRMLLILDNICKKHNIDYWLDYGTLLGAVRHNNFIPWDHEADIGMLRSDFMALKKIIKNELPEDCFFQCVDTDPEYIYFPVVEAKLRDRYSSYTHNEVNMDCKWHNGIQVDIFVYDKDDRNDYCISNAFERYYSESRIHLKFEEVQYTIECGFNNHQFPIPIGFDLYLKRNYDDYHKLPPLENQTPPFVKVLDACEHPESLVWKKKYI